MSRYAVLFDTFWTGQTGRAIRERGGKDAQVLGLYLISSRFANMLGLYRVFIDDIRGDTGLGPAAIARALQVTRDADFATFDAATSFVWVSHMARFRLNLQENQALEPDDKRVIAANRIYHALEPNPFLGEFFDANRKALRLSRRRESTGLVVRYLPKPQMSPLEGATKALGSQVQRSEISRSEIRDQKKAAASPQDNGQIPKHEDPNDARQNLRVITRLVHDVIAAAAETLDFASLKDDIKRACAVNHIAYDAQVVGAAIESALVQRAKAHAS